MKTNVSDPKVSISIRVFPEEKAELLAIAKQEDDSIDRVARMMLRDAMARRKANASAEEMEFVA
jgi:hypothetical protein